MGDVRIFLNPDHMNDRIGLANVGQELVTQNLQAPGTVDERRRNRGQRSVSGTYFDTPHGLGYGVEAVVVHRDHRDAWARSS